MKIGVTGVGGGSGQGIIKALKIASWDKDFEKIDIFPVDVKANSVGLYTCKHPGTVLPKPEDDILPWIEWAETMKLDAIIPGADRDLWPLSASRSEFPCKILVSSPNQIFIGDDKFETAAWLSERDFDKPRSSSLFSGQVRRWAATTGQEFGYPCVIKPRSDAASRGFHICQDEEELVFYAAHTDRPIIQELLDGDEYTCSVFYAELDQKVAASCILKRSLYAGNTYQCELVQDAEIDAFVRAIAAQFKPFGPLNIQLKRTLSGRLVPFEFNVRCSGSTGIRAHLGYNDPKMLIQHYLLGETIQSPTLPYGKICYRFFDELYLDNAADQHGEMPAWM